LLVGLQTGLRTKHEAAVKAEADKGGEKKLQADKQFSWEEVASAASASENLSAQAAWGGAERMLSLFVGNFSNSRLANTCLLWYFSGPGTQDEIYYQVSSFALHICCGHLILMPDGFLSCCRTTAWVRPRWRST
jgi:hypothetical protein